MFWGCKNALDLSCKRPVYFIGTMILRSVVAYSVTIHCCFVMHENMQKKWSINETHKFVFLKASMAIIKKFKNHMYTTVAQNQYY